MSSPEFPSVAVPEQDLPFVMTEQIIQEIAKAGKEVSDRVRYTTVVVPD